MKTVAIAILVIFAWLLLFAIVQTARYYISLTVDGSEEATIIRKRLSTGVKFWVIAFGIGVLITSAVEYLQR